MTRRSVDLPQPLGPMRATIPPPSMVRSTPSRTGSGAPVRGRERAKSRGHRVHGSRRPPVMTAPTVSGRRIGAVAGYSATYASKSARRSGRPARVAARSGRSIRVIAPIALGRSAYAPIPTAPRIADPRTAVSSTAGTATRKPGDVGLDLVPEAAARRAAADPHLGDRDAGREHRRRDVADGERRRLDDGPRDVAAAVAQGQAGEHAARLRVPDRRALAREVRQEDEAVGARGRGLGLGEERARSCRVPPRIASRYQSSARPVAAIAAPTL